VEGCPCWYVNSLRACCSEITNTIFVYIGMLILYHTSKCQLCIVGEDSGGTSGSHVRHGKVSCRLLVLPLEDLPALTHSTYLSIAQVLQC